MQSVFVSRNYKDFSDPEIMHELRSHEYLSSYRDAASRIFRG